MNKATLEGLQPQLYQRFQAVLAADRLGHAYLFSGSMGSFELALLISQSLFCQQKEEALACGACRTCRLIEQGGFSDVTVVEPQGNLIKTDRIRDLVKQFAQSGFEGSQQVFIIREAEKMHINAANSLLKVIEEPQSTIYLFLLTDNEEQVLSTIKSRTQIVSFPKNLAALERILEEGGLLKTQASLLAKLVADSQSAQKLAHNKAFLESIQPSRTFVSLLLTNPQQAYLQAGAIVGLVSEKAEQERLLDLLSILLAEHLPQKEASQTLRLLLDIRQMWKANVSLQNCLEYLALQQARLKA